MVDFNNEATIGTPAVDVVRILILQRRSDFIEALEKYHKQLFLGTSPDLSVSRARMISLFIEIQAMIRRSLKDPEYDDLISKVWGDQIQDLMGAFEIISKFLDEIRLTRLDNKRAVNKLSWEAMNQNAGF